MDHGLDWNLVQPERKWQVLRQLRVFAAWAVYSSIGSMMLGKLSPRLPAFISANSQQALISALQAQPLPFLPSSRNLAYHIPLNRQAISFQRPGKAVGLEHPQAVIFLASLSQVKSLI